MTPWVTGYLHPYPSPTGELTLVWLPREEQSAIINREGEVVHLLPLTPGNRHREIHWSPDGRLLAFTVGYERELVILAADSGQVLLHQKGKTPLGWADPRQLYVLSGELSSHC